LEEAPKGQVPAMSERNSQAKGLQLNSILERSRLALSKFEGLTGTPKGINSEVFRNNLSGQKTGGRQLNLNCLPLFIWS